jgi:hypothetical protein
MLKLCIMCDIKNKETKKADDKSKKTEARSKK